MGRMYHRRLLRGVGGSQRVFLASPAYGGFEAGFTFAYFETAIALARAGIEAEPAILAGDCHVDDARNRLVRDFLLSDCTDLFFLDSDLRWEAEDLISLLGHGRNIVAATYPVREGEERYPVRMLAPTAQEDPDGLIEVEGVPTGFLRIRRGVLEALADGAAWFHCKSDKRGDIPVIFERTVVDGLRWGGDYNFCRKARALGERVFLDPGVHLEHHGRDFNYGSFGGWLRQANGTVLSDGLARIRTGQERSATFIEMCLHWDNPWAAGPELLAVCAALAKQATGPILEMGSGLTTLVMAAAAPEQTVWCIEHDVEWAGKIEQAARAASILNIAICTQPHRGGWYDLSDLQGALPEQFALALVDGPPQQLGSRMPFYGHFGTSCGTILADDMDDPEYASAVKAWAATNGRQVDTIDGRSALIRKKAANHGVVFRQATIRCQDFAGPPVVLPTEERKDGLLK